MIPREDTWHVLKNVPSFRGRILINGVGWFGSWLVEVLRSKGLEVIPRKKSEPWPTKHFDYAIHSAYDGVKEFLDFCENLEVPRTLYISSGAVYQRNDAYADKKRLEEKMCNEHPANPIIARCYTFMGPGQKMDSHWAVANFFSDALAGRDIKVKNPQAVRSYMHMADLMIWLLTILVKGEQGKSYNVGSEYDITMDDLAHRIARFSNSNVVFTGAGAWDYYVPQTFRAKELGLKLHIPLTESLTRTWEWLNRS